MKGTVRTMATKKKAVKAAGGSKRSDEEWRELIALFEESGLRQVDFCAEMGVDAKQFSYQRSKRMGPQGKFASGGSGWVEAVPSVATASEKHAVPASAVTVRVGGFEVDVRPGFDAALLREVCKALSCPA